MATGTQAFTGPSPAVIFEGILNRRPTPPGQLNPSVPLDLTRSIDKALEKERRFRYQHAADVRADLERLRRDLSSPTAVETGYQPVTQQTVVYPTVRRQEESVESVRRRKGSKRA